MFVRSLLSKPTQQAAPGGAAAKQEEKAKLAEASETPVREAVVVAPPAKKAKKSKRRRSKKDKILGVQPANFILRNSRESEDKVIKRKDKDDNIKSKKRSRGVFADCAPPIPAQKDGTKECHRRSACSYADAAAPGVSERFSDLMLGIEEEDSEGEPNSGGPGAEKAELFDPEAPPQLGGKSLRPSALHQEPVTPPATSPPQRGAAVDPGDAEKASALIEDVELAFPSLMRFDLDFEQLGSVRLKDQAQAQGVLNSIDPLFWEVCGVKQLGHRLLFAKGLRALPPGPQRVFCSKQPVNSRVAMLAPGVMNGVIRRDYDYDYHDFRQA
ncbi:hypothetical protein AK812_SmicGene2815 [Symbiodinium microadriaticum]|uniref:Uncharacterized protein n=1 Tax=Symbiodinium microadriaticum TaxID=2951 RepID=A0A1Q9F0W1_SYMMI|nr:hypothetical protein AK812_SmicGene2815 [Symbiodinium microadriaticum]